MFVQNFKSTWNNSSGPIAVLRPNLMLMDVPPFLHSASTCCLLACFFYSIHSAYMAMYQWYELCFEIMKRPRYTSWLSFRLCWFSAHEQPSDNEQMIRFIQKIITHDQDLLIQTSYRTLVVIFKQVNLMTLMSEKKTSPRNQMKVIVSQGRSASLSWGVLEQPESCYSKDSSVSEWSFDANHHKVMMYILYIVESISKDTACLGIFVDISIYKVTSWRRWLLKSKLDVSVRAWS